MRALFYLEPLIERQRPFWKEGWLDFARSFHRSLISVGAEFRIVVGEPLADAARKRGFTEAEMAVVDFQPLVGTVGRDYLDITSRWYHGEQGAVSAVPANLVAAALGDYVPDVVFTFSSAPFLQTLFPLARVLNIEVGMFSRRPFPMTLYFDARGMFKDSLPCHAREVINAFTASHEELAFIAGLRTRYLDQGLSRLLPAAHAVYGSRLQGWRARLLLPLQFSGYYGFDANGPYGSQFDLLQAVLRQVPADVAVVVTEHPENPVVTDEIAAYLSQRHPNFIWDIRGRSIYAASQLLLLLCDAVATVSSAVGMHALLYQRPLISLGTSYMTPFADAHSLDALDQVLARGPDPRRDHALYWLFSRYYVLFESTFDGEWFNRFCSEIDHRDAAAIAPLYSLQQLQQHYLPSKPPVLTDILLEAGLADTVREQPRVAAGVRAIAFHLPQFHAFPENDAWWGEGFTEWTNVRQGRPLFDGHEQPRVPGELGYYDLSDVRVLARQAELARTHGLEGFCFYYYWFDGHRLLEKPVDQLLQHPEIELPFCLCWANENWTRRWDGGEQELLMRQSYSDELDERFALDALPYLRDRRYIRIDGRLMFLVYRLDIIPDVARAAATWREVWRREGLGEVYLIGVESFKAYAPADAGFDATCEFLPHQVSFERIAPDRAINRVLDPRMTVGDYGKLADHWIERPRAPYKRFRGLVPSWDNSARRRRGGATLFVGASPERYARWLRKTVARTLEEFEGDERVVFINAWNEWGEGCYLEPDQRHGDAYLQATREVLSSDEATLLEELRGERQVRQREHDPVRAWLTRRYPDDQPILSVPQAPRIHVVVLANADDAALQATADSLAESAVPLSVHGLDLGAASAAFDRLRWPRVDAADGVATALNALARAQGDDWLLLVQAGTTFVPAAMALLSGELAQDSECRAVYADELIALGEGEMGSAFRPDFNLDLLLSYPGAMARHWLYRCSAVRAVDGFDARAGSAFELDLLLRLVEHGGLGGLGHVPEPIVLAPPPPEQANADEQTVLLAHLFRRGYGRARVSAALPGTWRVHYVHDAQPLVSIIIPTRDQLPLLQQCVESLLGVTAYKRFELLIVDNDSQTDEARAWLLGLEQMGLENVRVLRYPQSFNYSAMNNLAAREARGDYLLLLNNDTAAVRADWLEQMLNHALRPEVGIVGAKLVYPNGRVQHAGVLLGLRGPAEHPYNQASLQASGYMNRLKLDQDLSAVTGACLMIRRSLYEQVGGLDEGDFKVSYNDIDLCLKVVQSGHLVVWTPHAVVMHVGSASQNTVDTARQQAKFERFMGEQDALYALWLPQLVRDPAYNRNLSLDAEYTPDPFPPRRAQGLPRLLVLPSDPTGCGNYRVFKPFQALLRAGRVEGVAATRWPQLPELARFDPDVLVAQKATAADRVHTLRRVGQHLRALRVAELDDYLPNLPLKSVHRAAVPKDIARMLRQSLAHADRLVVSTRALADTVRSLHPDIRVVENRLPVDWWGDLPPRRRREGRPRVGWAGGVGHSGDLEIVTDVVRELAGEVDWVFFGLCTDALLPHVRELYAGVATEHYPAQLAGLDLDVAIAPLEDNLFNRCKSNLRLLEYGACGYPVVCSQVGPYADGRLPVTAVKNRFKDWVAAIRALIDDRDEAARQGETLRAAVQAHWMLEGDHLDAWEQAWTVR